MLMPYPVEFAYATDSVSGSNPTATFGTSVTSGASNADGTAVALIGTALTHDVEWIEIFAHTNSGAGVSSSTLLDILIDPAGGTSWADFILSLPAGFLSTLSVSVMGGRWWAFPVWIPAGATIGAKARNETGSTRAVTVGIWTRGGVRQPGHWWCGQRVDAYGDDRATSKGTVVTPDAATNTYGAWTSIGAVTTRRYGAVSVSCQGGDDTMASIARQCQFGVGSTQVGPTWSYASGISETVNPLSPTPLVFRSILEGSQLQMRDRAAGATQEGNQFILHGVA
jgi:hypothetical protein